MKNLRKVLLTGIITMVTLFIMTTLSNATTVKVTGDTLNIRKGPSTSEKVVAMLYKGTECELLGEEGDWYQVKYKNYTGYISKQYAETVGEVSKPDDETNKDNSNTDNSQDNNNKVDDNQNTNNSNSENSNSSTETTKLIYKKFQSDTKISILPLIHSSHIGNAKKGEEVLILTQTSNWSYIQTDSVSGWVRNDILGEERTVGANAEPSDNPQFTEKTAYINEEYVNVRKGAGTSYKIVKVLTLNAQVTVIGEEGDWYQIKSGTDTGYISKEFVSDTKKVTSRDLTTPRTENDKTNQEESQGNQEINTDKNKDESNKTDTTDENNSKDNTTTSKIKGADIIAYSKKYLGHKYVYGADGTDKNQSFDCSGFTKYVYKHFGISLPHGATSQYKSGKGTKITKQSNLQIGDIVFLTDYETGVGIGHCGIYIGDGNFIHASTTTYKVTISSLNTMYKGRFYAGLRLI